MAKLGHSFWLQLSALLLLSCSSESPMGIDGTLVRLHLTGADLSQVTKANLHITATDSQNQMKVGDSTFTSAPFDVLGVTFPPGAVAATTYHVEVFGDASCLLAQGDAMLTIDHDGQYDVSVQLKAPDLPGDTDPDGGECAVMLHDLPVLVRYELTFDGCDEIAEVNEVSIGGHTIPAAYFDADTRRVWASECMQARGGL